MAYFIDDGGRRLEQFRMEIRKCSPLLQEYIAFLESEYERLSKLHQPTVISQRELLLDFAEYSENDKKSEHLDELVDNYLDSIKQ
jgi:hypothetical protein